MSKRKIEAKAWLKEIGFDDAAVEEMAVKFTAAQLEKIAEGYMRQDDYSRQSNELQTAQQALIDAQTALNAEMADWATIQAQGGQATAQMQRDLEVAQAKVATLTQRVTNIATQAGLDPDKALEGIDVTTKPTTPPPPAAPAIDETKFVSRDDFNRGYGELAQAMLRVPVALLKIGREHTQLFGAPVDEQAIIDEIQTRAATRGNKKSLDPIVIWEELHNVPAKRVEVAAAERQRDIAAAEQRGREAALSEISVPGAHTPTGRHSPIFGGAERKSVLERPQPQGTVNAAAGALRSGKYRQPAAKSA